MLKQEQAPARQAVFRAVVDAFAHPGRIVRIAPEVIERAGPLSTLMVETLAVATDRVYLSPVLPDADAAAARLAETSGIRNGGLAEASVAVFAGHEATAVLPRLRRGVLEFPDEGATAIALVDELATDGDAPGVVLSGPGVDAPRLLRTSGLASGFVPVWEEVNRRFPLGVDMILVDAAGRIAGLPRSSAAVEAVGREGR